MRSNHEYKLLLEEQIQFIKSSCNAFDLGNQSESKRIATAIYMLFNDYRKNISITTQMNIKRHLRFFATDNQLNNKNLLTECNLIYQSVTENGLATEFQYKPVLNDTHFFRRVQFHTWWDEDIIRDKFRRTISRKSLVFMLRNKDGGAHVDPEINNDIYESLSRENSLNWNIVDIKSDGCEERSPAPGPELVIMRQIGHEVLKTFDDFFEPNKIF